MQINEIHQLNDNQPVHSSKAMADKIRGSGGPHSVNVTSQWLLILTPPHSAQYIIVLLLIHDLTLYDQALRAATKWQPVLKKPFNISTKILLISTLKSQKIVHRMSSICLVYMGKWQHSPEIETSSKLECIYHEPLTNKMYKLWNFLKLDMFSVFIFAYIHSPLLPLSMPFFTSATMS